MRTPLALKVAFLGASLTAAPAAHALEMEFYTWNAFEETVAGFQRVALVLQDPGFLVFALVFAVLGTLVGLLTAAAKGVMGQQINPVSVLIPAVIGIAIAAIDERHAATVLLLDLRHRHPMGEMGAG
mgnify:CR=1 FL=1